MGLTIGQARAGGRVLSEILSQAEIEALLTSLSSDEDDAEPGDAKGASGASAAKSASPVVLSPSIASMSYEVYDFRRPDKFSKEQLRTLQMLHETFGRLAGNGLSSYLRDTVFIDMISLEQVPYEEYLRSINQSVFAITSLPPLSGQAVLELEFSLVFSMIDKLLGGPGKTIDRSILTDIEIPLVRQIIERLYGALKTAWEGVVIVNPGIEGIETSAQFVQIAPPTDIVVSILFEVRIGDVRGAMSLCIPYMVLKPITTKLSAQKWFATSQKRSSSGHRRQLIGQVRQAAVECSIDLGHAELTIADLVRLRPGDVLKLDQKSGQDLNFLVSDTPKFVGKPALDGKNVVFTITGAHE